MTKGAVLLKQRRPTRRSRLVGFGTETEKDARRSGTLLG
jgi:hypothetical protein